jgi:hypothetical protein
MVVTQLRKALIGLISFVVLTIIVSLVLQNSYAQESSESIQKYFFLKTNIFFKCSNNDPNTIVMNGNTGIKYLGPHAWAPLQASGSE